MTMTTPSRTSNLYSTVWQTSFNASKSEMSLAVKFGMTGTPAMPPPEPLSSPESPKPSDSPSAAGWALCSTVGVSMLKLKPRFSTGSSGLS